MRTFADADCSIGVHRRARPPKRRVCVVTDPTRAIVRLNVRGSLHCVWPWRKLGAFGPIPFLESSRKCLSVFGDCVFIQVYQSFRKV